MISHAPIPCFRARRVPAALWLAAGLALAGCTVGPDYTPPEADVPSGYVRASAEAMPLTDMIWWQGYGDDDLSSLVDLALGENLDIAAQGERLAEARALVRVASASGAPQLDGALDAEGRTRLAGQRDGGDSRADFGASAVFSWMPDLFGGRARAVEAAEAEARRQDLLREDLIRLTASDVVRRFVEVRRDAELMHLVDTSLELQEQTLGLVRTRFEAGLAARLDMTRAEADFAATRAQRPALSQSMHAAVHALEVLTGSMPGAIVPDELAEGGIPAYGGGPGAGVPRDMVRQRADVAAAEAALARASAGIGVAEAELYPMLTLPGRIRLGADGVGTGSVVEQVVGVLGAALSIPIFDSGGRQAEVTAAEARAREALLVYRQTVLRALSQVETALAAVEAARARESDLSDAALASAEAFEQAEDLYSQGLASFTEVLDAQRNLLSNRQDLARARADLALAFADLYTSTGAPSARP